jgi:hypothetical protein
MELYEALAPVLSSVAIIVSLFAFFKTRRVTLYQDLDRLYIEVLKLAIEHPRFVNPKFTLDYQRSFKGEELLQYEAYAFIVWNVCETIADHRKDKTLFRSWEPVLKAENERHRAWFDTGENRSKFKMEFRDLIQKHYQPPQRAVQGAASSHLEEEQSAGSLDD